MHPTAIASNAAPGRYDPHDQINVPREELPANSNVRIKTTRPASPRRPAWDTDLSGTTRSCHHWGSCRYPFVIFDQSTWSSAPEPRNPGSCVEGGGVWRHS